MGGRGIPRAGLCHLESLVLAALLFSQLGFYESSEECVWYSDVHPLSPQSYIGAWNSVLGEYTNMLVGGEEEVVI